MKGNRDIKKSVNNANLLAEWRKKEGHYLSKTERDCKPIVIARPGVRQTLNNSSNNAHKRASILRFYRLALSIFDNTSESSLRNVCVDQPFALHFIFVIVCPYNAAKTIHK